MTRTYDCDDYNDDDDDNCDLCLLMSQTYVRVQAEYTHWNFKELLAWNSNLILLIKYIIFMWSIPLFGTVCM